MTGFNMLLPFDTDEPEFCRGFEAGRVWDILGAAIVEERLPTEPLTIHASNAEMFIRMADVQGVRAVSTDLDDTWIEVVFEALVAEARRWD